MDDTTTVAQEEGIKWATVKRRLKFVDHFSIVWRIYHFNGDVIVRTKYLTSITKPGAVGLVQVISRGPLASKI